MSIKDDDLPLLRKAIDVLHQNNAEVTFEKPIESELEKECSILESSEKLAKLLVSQLFGDHVPQDGSFYDILGRLPFYLRHQESSNRVLTVLWKSAYKSLNKSDRNKLLLALSHSGHQFFRFIQLMQPLVEMTNWTSKEALEWFFAIRSRLKNNGFTGYFWHAAGFYVSHFPKRAIEILKLFHAREKSEYLQEIGAYVLARLRVAELRSTLASQFRRVDHSFESSGNRWYIDCYLNSWLNYAHWQPLHLKSAKTLQPLLEEDSGCPPENAARIVFVLLGKPQLPNDTFDFLAEWVSKRLPLKSPNSRFLATIPLEIASAWPTLALGTRKFLERLAVESQPLLPENESAWFNIERFLLNLAANDTDAFNRCFTALVERNPIGFASFLESNPHGELLENIRRDNATDRLTVLMLSQNQFQRVGGIQLFRILGSDSLGKSLLKATDSQIGMLLCDFVLYGQNVADQNLRFLLALADRVEIGDGALKQAYGRELTYQAKNYKSGILSALKRLQKKTPIVESVVAHADAYFAAINENQDSAALAIVVGGFSRAASTKLRELREQVMHKSWEKSVFAEIMPVRHLLYTDRMAGIDGDGKFRETALNAFEVSIEFPRMEMMDPEIAEQRRRNAHQLLEWWNSNPNSDEPLP